MKVSFEVSGPAIEAQRDNIAAVLGHSNLNNLTDVEKLTVNYKVDLPINKDMLLRLRALADLAEECSSIQIESEEDSLLNYCECIRLMQDLISISEKRRVSDWD